MFLGMMLVLALRCKNFGTVNPAVADASAYSGICGRDLLSDGSGPLLEPVNHPRCSQFALGSIIGNLCLSKVSVPCVSPVWPLIFVWPLILATNLLIAVEGDPPADIYQLQNVTFVMKGGVTDKVLKAITKPVV
jgi:hypothetical protein